MDDRLKLVFLILTGLAGVFVSLWKLRLQISTSKIRRLSVLRSFSKTLTKGDEFQHYLKRKYAEELVKVFSGASSTAEQRSALAKIHEMHSNLDPSLEKDLLPYLKLKEDKPAIDFNEQRIERRVLWPFFVFMMAYALLTLFIAMNETSSLASLVFYVYGFIVLIYSFYIGMPLRSFFVAKQVQKQLKLETI